MSSPEELDHRLMGVALRCARSGRPSPNPHVGAVVARGSSIVSTGYHRRAGEDHAEVMALRRAGRRAEGSTLYVTLEPCNHDGRTPPCTEAIMAARIARVVVGCRDPAPHVPGATRRLRRAGISVTLGCREPEASALIRDFTKHIREGLPYVILKAAITLDDKMATRTGASKWITGEAARRDAHRMRARADAILVGVGTCLADDPRLTVRAVRGRSPTRVVLDGRLRIAKDSWLVREPVPAGTWVFHGPRAPRGAKSELEAAGVRTIEVPRVGNRLDLEAVLRELASRNVVRLLVEGGPTVHSAMLKRGFVDEAALYVAPRFLADARAASFATGFEVSQIGDGFGITKPEYRALPPDFLIQGPLEK